MALLGNSNYWIRSKIFDSSLFILPGLVVLLALIPYSIFRESSVLPIYIFYFVFFGIPHNLLTYSTFLQQPFRASYDLRYPFIMFLIAFVLGLIVYSNFSLKLTLLLLTLISFVHIYHVSKQHIGICVFYDKLQSTKLQETSILKVNKQMYWGFVFCIISLILWVYTHKEIGVFGENADNFKFSYPVVPKPFFYFCSLFSAIFFVSGLIKSTVLRKNRSLFIPWPQIFIMIFALGSFIIPFFFISIKNLAISTAIFTIYHAIQYFTFVWLYQNFQGEFHKINVNSKSLQVLALNKKWPYWLLVCIVASIILYLLVNFISANFALGFAFFFSLSHNLIDGFIWKGKYNNTMGEYLKSLV